MVECTNDDLNNYLDCMQTKSPKAFDKVFSPHRVDPSTPYAVYFEARIIEFYVDFFRAVPSSEKCATLEQIKRMFDSLERRCAS